MHNLKIISEELSFDKINKYIEGCFTLSNTHAVKFEVTTDYYRQWGASDEQCGFTVDRLSEIQKFYFGFDE
jgi:hypothetical protein